MSFSHELGKIQYKSSFVEINTEYEIEKLKGVLTIKKYSQKRLARVLFKQHKKGNFAIILDENKYNKKLIKDLVEYSYYNQATLDTTADYVFWYLNLGDYEQYKLLNLTGEAYNKGLEGKDAWGEAISEYIRLYKS